MTNPAHPITPEMMLLETPPSPKPAHPHGYIEGPRCVLWPGQCPPHCDGGGVTAFWGGDIAHVPSSLLR